MQSQESSAPSWPGNLPIRSSAKRPSLQESPGVSSLETPTTAPESGHERASVNGGILTQEESDSSSTKDLPITLVGSNQHDLGNAKGPPSPEGLGSSLPANLSTANLSITQAGGQQRVNRSAKYPRSPIPDDLPLALGKRPREEDSMQYTECQTAPAQPSGPLPKRNRRTTARARGSIVPRSALNLRNPREFRSQDSVSRATTSEDSLQVTWQLLREDPSTIYAEVPVSQANMGPNNRILVFVENCTEEGLSDASEYGEDKE